MGDTRLLRLTPSATLKEKRLADLLLQRGAADAERAVEDAQVAGSLELAAATEPADREGLRRALRISPGERFAVAALIEWHAEITGGSDGLRTGPAERPQGPPPCPPEFIRARLEGLEVWLGSESATELTAGQRGALVLARLIEILPFGDANGRVAALCRIPRHGELWIPAADSRRRRS